MLNIWWNFSQKLLRCWSSFVFSGHLRGSANFMVRIWWRASVECLAIGDISAASFRLIIIRFVPFTLFPQSLGSNFSHSCQTLLSCPCQNWTLACLLALVRSHNHILPEKKISFYVTKVSGRVLAYLVEVTFNQQICSRWYRGSLGDTVGQWVRASHVLCWQLVAGVSAVSPWIVSQWPAASIICHYVEQEAAGPGQQAHGWELSGAQTTTTTTTTTTSTPDTPGHSHLTCHAVTVRLCKECLTPTMSWHTPPLSLCVSHLISRPTSNCRPHMVD